MLTDYYGDDFVMTTNYYSPVLELIKAAIETAGTTTDRDAINNAIKEVDIDVANGHLSYNGDSALASQMYICQMEDQQAKLIKGVTFR